MCFNCGLSDHFESRCPKPFDPQSAFRPPQRKSFHPSQQRNYGQNQHDRGNGQNSRTYMMNVMFAEDGIPNCQIEAVEPEEKEITEEEQFQEWEEEEEIPNLEPAVEEQDTKPVEVMYHNSVNQGYLGMVTDENRQDSDDDYSAYVPITGNEVYPIEYRTGYLSMNYQAKQQSSSNNSEYRDHQVKAMYVALLEPTVIENAPIIDTGSNINIVGRPWLKRQFKKENWITIKQQPLTTKMGSGQTISSHESTFLKIRDKNHRTTSVIHCYISDEQCPPILGNSYLIDMQCSVDLYNQSMNTKHGRYDLHTSANGLMRLSDIWVSTVKTPRDCPAIAPVRNTVAHPNPVLLDCGAASTVVGKEWLEKQQLFYQQFSIPSKKQFRFGNSMIFPSLGKIILALPVHDERKTGQETTVFVPADVVACPIPCLLSRPALETLKGTINFHTNRVESPSFAQTLAIEPSGHIRLRLTNPPTLVDQGPSSSRQPGSPTRKFPTFAEWPSEIQDTFTGTEGTITKEQIKKLHLQFNHASEGILERIIKGAGLSATKDDIIDITRECQCHTPGNRPQRPVTSSFQAKFPGQVVHMDVFFPALIDAKNRPYLLIVDNMTRLTISIKLGHQTGTYILHKFITHWVTPFGVPQQLYTDAGKAFTHKDWQEWTNLYGITNLFRSSQKSVAERISGKIGRHNKIRNSQTDD